MKESNLQSIIDYVRLDLIEQMLRNLSLPVGHDRQRDVNLKVMSAIERVEELKEEVHEIIGDEVDLDQYLRFME